MELKDLPIGSKVRDTKSGYVFLVAAHNHPGYPGTLLLCDTVLSQRSLDAIEPNGSDDQKKYGNNEYALSNLNQWLNSGRADGWFSPTHLADTAPSPEHIYNGAFAYDSAPGFLTELSEAFNAAIVVSDVPCFSRDEKHEWRVKPVKMKVTIPSRTEIGFGDEGDGSLIPLLADYRYRLAPPDPRALGIKDRNYFHRGENWWHWLRTPVLNTDCLSWHIQPGLGFGMNDGEYPCYGHTGVRPMAALRDGAKLGEPDENGIRDII